MLFGASAVAIHVPHAHTYFVDCSAESSQREMQAAINVLAKACRDLDAVAEDRESHDILPAGGVTLPNIVPCLSLVIIDAMSYVDGCKRYSVSWIISIHGCRYELALTGFCW